LVLVVCVPSLTEIPGTGFPAQSLMIPVTLYVCGVATKSIPRHRRAGDVHPSVRRVKAKNSRLGCTVYSPLATPTRL